ncbi:MAG: right-handed parallel beta-helix repeat-containing protein [Phycisphaeraceae bacterium]|nr:right-handed parallel beta-helix repeat-containing protein [Phycisphaeraceae bacterium]
MKRAIHPRTAVAAVALASAAILIAGPLDPPAGPVASTPKTLAEIEPRIPIGPTTTPGDADSLYRITQPGSYYLTGNVAGVANKRGIEIAASGVTIDLMGFELVGIRESLEGIAIVESGPTNISITNGTVREWGAAGINLYYYNAINSTISRIRALDNGDDGIGIGRGGRMIDCASMRNLNVGIVAAEGAMVSGCSSYDNGGVGIFGRHGAVFLNCTASLNGGHGFEPFGSVTLSNCTAYGNEGDGIVATAGSTVIGCHASSNDGSGIVAEGSTVSHCYASSNTLNGIRVTSDSLILSNTCDSNGFFGDGAGIHVTSSDNRIEGNHCTDADRGIDIDGGGNIVIRNTCSGNTLNWSIAIGNAVAPIVQAATNAIAISGNTFGGSLGSSDPNANFTF